MGKLSFRLFLFFFHSFKTTTYSTEICIINSNYTIKSMNIFSFNTFTLEELDRKLKIFIIIKIKEMNLKTFAKLFSNNSVIATSNIITIHFLLPAFGERGKSFVYNPTQIYQIQRYQ